MPARLVGQKITLVALVEIATVELAKLPLSHATPSGNSAAVGIQGNQRGVRPRGMRYVHRHYRGDARAGLFDTGIRSSR